MLYVICLASCSVMNSRTCQIDDDVDYLKTNALQQICFPDSIMDFYVSKKYYIPDCSDDNSSHVGKDLDICPPKVIG